MASTTNGKLGGTARLSEPVTAKSTAGRMTIAGESAGSNRFRQSPVVRGAPQKQARLVATGEERRRRRRVAVQSMYTFATLRILSRRTNPIEAYIVDLSETGMAIESDARIPLCEIVTVEFRVPGIGRPRHDEWPEFAVAAEVLRHDLVDDFPGGPYRMALRFGQLPTMTQAHIARFVATQPG